MVNEENCALIENLEWDSKYFGFPIARVSLVNMSEDQVQESIVVAREQGVKLLYVFNEKEKLNQLLTQLGGLHVDTKLTYSVALDQLVVEDFSILNSANISSFDQSKSSELLWPLSIQSGEYSRFKVDPGLNQHQFENLFKTWIDSSVNRSIADEVFVIGKPNEIRGMVTVVKKNNCGEIGLLATGEESRGRGYGTMLVRKAQQWCLANDCATGRVVTQEANKAASGLYEKCGYQIHKKEYIFHVWLK